MNASVLHLTAVVILTILAGCTGQSESGKKQKIIGEGCDGCELMYINMPDEITEISYSPAWGEEGQKLLITGTVYELDGETVAPDVIIYYWHTDTNGYYSSDDEMAPETKRHGYIRGWVKTNARGHYFIYTIRPAPYPQLNAPAHIHTSVKEPEIDTEYYIDEFVFEDDKLLTKETRKKYSKRGGSGILLVSTDGDLQVAKHDIILGLNIPNYPVSSRK